MKWVKPAMAKKSGRCRRPKNEAMLKKAAAGVGSTQETRPISIAQSALLEQAWLWGRVSAYLPLRCWERLGLRCVAPLVANAVLEELELQGSPPWEEDFFGGLLPDLLRLQLGDPCANLAGDGGLTLSWPIHQEAPSRPPLRVRRFLDSSSIAPWLAMIRAFPAMVMPSSPAKLPCGHLVRGAVGEDATSWLNCVPEGTLLWLDGWFVQTNCFNSIKLRGEHTSGPWLVKEQHDSTTQDAATVLHSCFHREGCQKPMQPHLLNEHRRFHGLCLLPYVSVEWACVANVMLGDPALGAGGSALAELLHPQATNLIERVSLPQVLATPAHEAVLAPDTQEVLLMRCSVGGGSLVPFRLVVYSSRPQGGQCTTTIVDRLHLSSHQHFCAPPPSVCFD